MNVGGGCKFQLEGDVGHSCRLDTEIHAVFREGAALDEERVLCTKKGLVSVDHQCRRFRYAPCKRIPVKPKAPDFKKYDEDDFSL